MIPQAIIGRNDKLWVEHSLTSFESVRFVELGLVSTFRKIIFFSYGK